MTRKLRIKIIKAEEIEELETAINAFLDQAGLLYENFIDVKYIIATPVKAKTKEYYFHSALIIYRG